MSLTVIGTPISDTTMWSKKWSVHPQDYKKLANQADIITN